MATWGFFFDIYRRLSFVEQVRSHGFPSKPFRTTHVLIPNRLWGHSTTWHSFNVLHSVLDRRLRWCVRKGRWRLYAAWVIYWILETRAWRSSELRITLECEVNMFMLQEVYHYWWPVFCSSRDIYSSLDLRGNWHSSTLESTTFALQRASRSASIASRLGKIIHDRFLVLFSWR